MSGEDNLPTVPPILAMVIGINDYSKSRYKNLSGAVADADHFEKYLGERLVTPDGKTPTVISLRDATRQQIVEGFTLLEAKYQELRQNGAIIIFYAGHGARTAKPTEWMDWHANDGQVEMICPSDIGQVNVEKGTLVEGIYDRTISALLSQLSRDTGANITLIMDCCSSGSINRNDDVDADGEVIREIYDPPGATAECDKDICASQDTRGGGCAEGFSGTLNSSHVLLAACGRDEWAYEKKKPRREAGRSNELVTRGNFTYHLLEVLESADAKDLTYTSLMDRLKMPNKQTPRCEGFAVNWRLFSNVDTEGADPSFIVTHRDPATGIITLEAGEACGISKGGRLTAHCKNLIGAPVMGKLRVKSAKMFSSTLEVLRADPMFHPPNLFYSKVVYTPDSVIKVYCPDKALRKSVFSERFAKDSGITLVKDVKQCDLHLEVTNGAVSFRRQFHNEEMPYLKAIIHPEVDTSEVNILREVVCASRNFYHHLTRPLEDELTQVKIELFELKESQQSINQPGDVHLVQDTAMENLLEKQPAILEVDEKAAYGMKIVSQTELPLYPFVFYFDATLLKIECWYPNPFNVPGGRYFDNPEIFKQVPNGLLGSASGPNSTLAIGYAESDVWPWGFTLQGFKPNEYLESDVGFFRIFLSTRPLPSFFSMQQQSPFPPVPGQELASDSDSDKRGGGPKRHRGAAWAKGPEDRCGAQRVTIVQVKSSNGQGGIGPVEFVTGPSTPTPDPFA
ncbi:hypothetical protein NLJ89_g333 [Agrocybe chaxingu]|uniref:Peptidase C14 caspase domain-containing protein n=1 Tax=Agrocybe chaxingu TaxID=84603 RepID=A0A9W8TG59_9AGAR|nr:hypothetical protein NLJ89_g333 [Agrocybe chaxingu]